VSDSLLTAKNLTVAFPTGSWWHRKGEFRALDDVSFDIRKGEIFGVMGRNGCGKTTLLRVLAGAARVTSGDIEEHTQQPLSKALLSIGFGFDRYLTGRDNAKLSAMLQGHSRKQAENSLEEIKEFSELEDFFDQPVLQYSSGMRSKLGFATAMTLDVDLMLVDETLSVGDENFRDKAKAAMMEKMSRSQAVVFVSHNAGLVDSLCQRAIWLEKGRVEAAGDTALVASKYQAFMKKMRQEKKPGIAA